MMDDTDTAMREAVHELGATFNASLSLFGGLRCVEVDSVLKVLILGDMRHVAENVLTAHAASDDEEDYQHHDLHLALKAGASGTELINMIRSHMPEAGDVEVCAECPDRIEYVYTRMIYGPDGGLQRVTGDLAIPRFSDRRWMHVGGGRNCERPYLGKRWASATARTKCCRCKGRGTLVTVQTPWGNDTSCKADGCTYRDYQSIGD